MPSTGARWLFRLLLVLVPPLLLFGIAEALSRAFGVPPLAEDESFQQLEFMRQCRSDEGLIERRCDAERLGRLGAERSVYVFGGSSAQGYPIGETVPFAGYMQLMLDQQRPGGFAVHNLGQACRDSIYVRKCAGRVGGEPSDIFVLYAGHNDFANFMVASPRLRILSEEIPGLWNARAALAHSRFYSLVSRAVQGRPRAKQALWSRLPDPQWAEAKQIALDEFTRNVTEVIERAKELGVSVVLVTVGSNLAEHPATRDRWHTVLDPESPQPEWLAPWREQFALGVAHHEAGRTEASQEAFIRARDLAMGGRAPSALNERLRELSRRYDHVELVDFERRLHDEGLREGLVGCNFFGTETWCDQFHPNPRAQRMIAESIVRKLVTM